MLELGGVDIGGGGACIVSRPPGDRRPCPVFDSARRYCAYSSCLFINMCWSQISQMRLEIETRFQWSTYRKWYIGNRMVT